MRFEYVLIAFSSCMPPLSAKKINEAARDYRFAPLSSVSVAPIYSADAGIWQLDGDRSRFFHPSQGDMESWLSCAINSKAFFLLALCDHEEFRPPGLSEEGIKLVALSDFLKDASTGGLVKAGYDVIDSWTGISALSNIGYDEADLMKFDKLNINSNGYGLLGDVAEARIFLELVTHVAPDHAPYEIVEVYVRLPNHQMIHREKNF